MGGPTLSSSPVRARSLGSTMLGLAACLLACHRGHAEVAAPSEAPSVSDALSSLARSSGPADAPEQEPEQTREPGAALHEAARILAAAKITDAYPYGDDYERMRALGLTLPLLEAALSDIVSSCMAEPAHCEALTTAPYLLDALVRAAGHFGDGSTLQVLLRLDAAGTYTTSAIDDILARLMADNLGPCAPPTEAGVAKVEATLDGFAVLDWTRDGLRARRLAPDERSDLAYFLTAVSQAEPEIRPRSVSRRNNATDPAQDQRRTAMLTQAHASVKAGDLATAQTTLVGYLLTLGWPDLDAAQANAAMTWGGPQSSNAMRDLAAVSEMLGEHHVAAELYRASNPGGGACGTSTSYRVGQQVRGVIRTVEQTRGCAPVIAERLLDWNNDFDRDEPPEPTGLGPGRLVAAGFDIVRLYRGALLTRNRSFEPEVIAAALHDLPPTHRDAALARLADRGIEDWERRIAAAEGLADVTPARPAQAGSGANAARWRSPAIEPLLALAEVAEPRLRARVFEALGDLTRRPQAGPCEDDGFGVGWGSISSQWSRQVDELGHTCATWLDDDEAAALARRIEPHAEAEDRFVAQAAIEALGKLAAPGSNVTLARVQERAAAGLAACEDDEYSDACQSARTRGDAARQAAQMWHEAFARSESD